MATIITHALAASALSTVAPRELPRFRLAIVLGILAMIPDLDVIGFRFGISYGDALGHRGFTHSILFAALAGIITPFIAFPKINAFCRVWWTVAGLAFIATLSHGLIDAFTDAGLGVGFFIPFENSRYFAPDFSFRSGAIFLASFTMNCLVSLLLV